jgi:hypothetical protein
VRRALSQKLSQVNACVHARLGAREEHPATIEADVTIGNRGRITQIALSTGLDPENLSIQRCVASTLDSIAFEPFRGAAVNVKHAFTVIQPTTADGDLQTAYMPVVFRRGEALVRACARAADPLASRADLLIEAEVGPGGTWESIGVAVRSGPSGAAFRSCVRRSVARLTLPDFTGEPHSATHFYGLTLD